MPRRVLAALLCTVLMAAAGATGDVAVAAAPAKTTLAHRQSHRRSHHRHHRHHHRRHHRRRRTRLVHAANAAGRLRFGVYPWGGAGAVAQVAPQLADDPFKALSAVKQLQGARSMTVHLYGQYTGTNPGEADALISDAKWWSDNGVRVEMVLRYRPARAALAGGYVAWVQAVSGRLAQIPDVVAIQVGNEPNNSSSPAAGDGAYPGAVAAIAQGVPAARQAVLASGRPDIKIGFNWAAGTTPCQTDPLFAALRRAGGRAFSAAVGWVGIDVYPGTWSAPSASVFPSAQLVQASVVGSLACLRMKQMPGAGLSSSVTITVAETGYPTDATRSEATQAGVLQTIIGAVQGVAHSYGVTDLRWFDLRDANTASGQLENGYGLMHDDYSPKPAFAALRQLIAAKGV